MPIDFSFFLLLDELNHKHCGDHFEIVKLSLVAIISGMKSSSLCYLTFLFHHSHETR